MILLLVGHAGTGQRRRTDARFCPVPAALLAMFLANSRQ